jgi:hypothetical protein
MPKIEGKKLFPEMGKEKGFGDLIHVILGSPRRATIEAIGVEITFAWVIEDGKKKLKPISKFKEGRSSPGSMDIPRDLYNAMKDRAKAVIKSHAEAEQGKSIKQQLENQNKQKQLDLF